MTPSSSLVHWRHPICQRHFRFRRVVGALEPVTSAHPSRTMADVFTPTQSHPVQEARYLALCSYQSSEASVTEIILHASYLGLLSSNLPWLDHLNSSQTLQGGNRTCSGTWPNLPTFQTYHTSRINQHILDRGSPNIR